MEPAMPMILRPLRHSDTAPRVARFAQAAFEGMRRLLGPLHDESYVLVDAVDGDAYSLGGRTENGRWAAAHPG
jgi:4-oxalocrotonate tautomerase